MHCCTTFVSYMSCEGGIHCEKKGGGLLGGQGHLHPNVLAETVFLLEVSRVTTKPWKPSKPTLRKAHKSTNLGSQEINRPNEKHQTGSHGKEVKKPKSKSHKNLKENDKNQIERISKNIMVMNRPLIKTH